MSSEVLPPPGKLIAGKYRLDRLIGRGGMGVVYAGRHELLGQPVAVKLLTSDRAGDATSATRFLNEARAAARIPSDHVVRVIDVGMDEQHPYFVMEYLEGQDLAHLLEERGRLTEKEAASYLLEAIEALAQAHALGIIHRDLKPSNLFLATKPDGSKVVKVLDFGIAKAFGPAASTQAAVTTQGLIGSPAYMAPEYVRSAKSIDTRADIWAIGVILYELLSGTVPFTGENPGEVLAAILENRSLPLQSVRKDVSPGLASVVGKCLARRPEDRYAELADVADALAPFAAKPSPSVARIRATVTTLKLKAPVTPDASGPISAVRADPNAPTAIAQEVSGAGQQTNQSWSDIGPAPTPSRLARGLAIGVGMGAVIGIAIVAIMMRGTHETPTSAAPAAPSMEIAATPASASASASAPAPAPASASTPAPRHHPRPARPAPQPMAPTLTRDRR